MSLGPLMVDIAGHELCAEDRDLLRHPLIGGVILFTRNYVDPDQLTALVASIHALREPSLLVAVDQEGGRVQRFRAGFTPLPPARFYGALYERDPKTALQVTEDAAWLMAAELRAVGVDLGFAPVADLDHSVSEVIGDRAFHHSAKAVGELCRTWLLGMRRAGMAATAKHFPGHGAVTGDSHRLLPVDERPLDEIRRQDLKPYERLIGLSLPSVMTAHVVYANVDSRPASFSRHWIAVELRRRLGFKGAIFCDDLGMQAAAALGDYPQRAQAALGAGCDMLPVCNSRGEVRAILDQLKVEANPVSGWRLARLRGAVPAVTRAELCASANWRGVRLELERWQAGEDFQLEA